MKKTCKHQTFCSYCDWDVTLQIKQILVQTHLHKCIRIASAALCFLHSCVSARTRQTQTSLCFSESQSPSDRSILPKCHFWQSSAQPEHDFSPCCSHHVNTIESLGNQKLPLTEILHLAETRGFLNVIVACVLLQ